MSGEYDAIIAGWGYTTKWANQGINHYFVAIKPGLTDISESITNLTIFFNL